MRTLDGIQRLPKTKIQKARLKKKIAWAGIVSLLVSSFVFVLPITTQAVVPVWDVTGSYVINVNYLSVDYPETLVLTQSETNIIGVSLNTIPPASGSAFTVISGSVIGDVINFDADQDAGSVVVHFSGTIDTNGSMSGDWADIAPGTREGTWETTSGAAVLDDDNDGLYGSEDLCPGTESDVDFWETGPLGINRWELGDENFWYQNKPVKKDGSGGYAPSDLTVKNTYGCSGRQILNLVSTLTGEDMDGHYKYGLSSSVLQEFIEDGNDGVIDGINANSPVETIAVPADNADGVSSANTLVSGKDYLLKASGTAHACVTGCGYSIIFDPEYSTSNGGTTWEDGVAAPYVSYGPNLLDLMVNGVSVNWDDDAVYNADHTYWYDFAGTGAPVSFQVFDLFYPNNSGNLTVDIFAKLY